MRIAIPLDENQQDVCIVLARAPYFLFREDGVDTIVENPAAQAQGGAGLQAAGMKIYQSVNKAAADDLKAMEEGQLEELTKFHAGYHGVQ